MDVVSEAHAIPVCDASFDAIVCTEVLEHVPEPIAVVREFGRIVAPGGRLILTAPLGSGIHQEPYHFYGGVNPPTLPPLSPPDRLQSSPRERQSPRPAPHPPR